MANHKINWYSHAEESLDGDLCREYKQRKYVDIVKNQSTGIWTVLFFGRTVKTGFSDRFSAKEWAEDNIKLYKE